MKKAYTIPELSVQLLLTDDILTLSEGQTDPYAHINSNWVFE